MDHNKKLLSNSKALAFGLAFMRQNELLSKLCLMASIRKPRKPLTPMINIVTWDTVSVDILEPNQSGTYRYVPVIKYEFTKWVLPRPWKKQTAEHVSEMIIGIFAYYGVPMKIHSDQGRNFESWLFKEVCKEFGIEKSQTTSYFPQSNGLMEGANSSIINILRKIYEGHD